MSIAKGRESVKEGMGGVNRKKAPRIKDAVEFELALKSYEKFTLDNGIDVYAVAAGPEEVIQIEWVFYAGNWYEKQNGIAAAPTILSEMAQAIKPLLRSANILIFMALILIATVIMRRHRSVCIV